MLQARWLRSGITVGLYWIFITVLFMLPGSALPKANWLNNIEFDKWVHIGFFTGLVFLLLSAFLFFRKNKWRAIGGAIAYGLLVELIQHFYVTNRSFDLGDWVADTTGSFLGFWLWWWVYKKNKPL